MTVHVENALVHFPDWYDERGEWEAESKGYLPGVQVEIAGERYGIFVYDPVRLTQDLEESGNLTSAVLAEPGMVVVPTVTRESILRAIPELVRGRFFDHLRPLAKRVSANGVHSN